MFMLHISVQLQAVFTKAISVAGHVHVVFSVVTNIT